VNISEKIVSVVF